MFLNHTIHTQWISVYRPYSEGDMNFTDARGYSNCVDGSGNSYVTGTVNVGGGGNDIIVIKYLQNGDTAWVRSYNGSENSNDEGYGICVDNAGNVYVVGTASNIGKSYDIVLLKYSSAGQLLWVRTYYGHDGSYEDRGLGVNVASDNFIYVTGFCTGPTLNKQIILQKYDPAGNLLWTVREDGVNDMDSEGLALTQKDGFIYVCGYITSATTGQDMIAIKYSSAGQKIWLGSYSGSGYNEDKAWGIVVDSENNVIIGGHVTNLTIDYAVVKFSSSGTTVWTRIINGSGNGTDKAFGLVCDLFDNSIYITGYTQSSGQGSNYLTIKYSSSGNLLWPSQYNGGGQGEDMGRAIGLIRNSTGSVTSVVVTGESWGLHGNYDYATVRYSPQNGTQTQLSIFFANETTNDNPKALCVSGSKVYITGYSEYVVDDGPSHSALSSIMLDWKDPLSENNLAREFELYQNYPNPFNPTTTIRFSVPYQSEVELSLYDVLGRKIAILLKQDLAAGIYSIELNASTLSSGIYFCKLSASHFRKVMKMTLIK
ncbi:MAG: SBBP repeat-containing protein [Ignavibacteria bacterium]|nr:SBBP repeat-containing protein [Ignavibacteria bacterium]